MIDTSNVLACNMHMIIFFKGMDQGKTSLPHQADLSKRISTMTKVKTHLTGKYY